MDNEDSKIEIMKKKKEATFIADNLDNTATPGQIVEFLQATHRKNKVATLYCQTVRQRQTTVNKYLHTKHFLLAGHPLNTFSEDWDGGLPSGYFEEFSHRSMMPKIISTVRNIVRKDPVTEYMNKKMVWKDTLIDYRRIMCEYEEFRYISGLITSRWTDIIRKMVGNTLISRKRTYKWINDEVLYCPKQLVHIAELYEQNPDPYFDSSYNWYYAGNGNLQLIEMDGINYLLQSEFNCLHVLPFAIYNLIVDYDNIVAKFQCDNDIFETTVMQNIVALRTKNKVYILKLIDSNDGLQIEKLKELASKLPFTGISFDEHHKNILYITTLDYKLSIVNIDRMAGRSRQLRGNVTSLVDNWSSVIGSERGYFTHVSKHSLTLYDKRTNKAFQRWKNLRRITDDKECNDISVARHCKAKPFLYFGTDHHLFLMDMRYNNKDNKLKAVQRWTHGMQCLPTYMTICDKFEHDKELICLSSQWCEDMCVVSNYAVRPTSDYDVRSVAVPYRPPNILQALNDAKQKILCCDLQNPIDNRLCTSITGLSVVEEDDKYHILMLNSLGDISAHTLCPRYMTAFFDDTSAELLSEWSKGYKKEEKPLEVSSITDISKFWKRLKRIPDDYKFGDNNMVRQVHKFDEKEIYESFEKEELEAGLLDIWTKSSTEHTDTKDESTLKLFFCDDD